MTLLLARLSNMTCMHLYFRFLQGSVDSYWHYIPTFFYARVYEFSSETLNMHSVRMGGSINECPRLYNLQSSCAWSNASLWVSTMAYLLFLVSMFMYQTTHPFICQIQKLLMLIASVCYGHRLNQPKPSLVCDPYSDI
jgi:hypothetical protein